MAKLKNTKISAAKKAGFAGCPCDGTTLDKLLQPVVLAILVEESLHGYELAKRIGEVPGFLNQGPDVSGVYRLLKNLETRGMVVAEWDISATDRAKKRYSITNDGRHCLILWYETLQNYRKTVDSLLVLIGKYLD